jgi:hypothetical protein
MSSFVANIPMLVSSNSRAREHLSDKEFELLTALEEAIASHRVTDIYDHHAILEDSAWHAVVAKAQLTRQQLLTLTVDPIEQGHLMGTI